MGSAGDLFNKMLKAINLNRELVYITNLIPWLPLSNNMPQTEEILINLAIIQKHIELIQPKVLILLGQISAKAVLGSNLELEKLRNKIHNYNNLYVKQAIPTIVTYHPSFLLNSPKYKKEAWKDLQSIERQIKNEKII